LGHLGGNIDKGAAARDIEEKFLAKAFHGGILIFSEKRGLGLPVVIHAGIAEENSPRSIAFPPAICQY